MSGGRPLVIAHRGASGHRPEHTLAGYELAIRLGADYIEPDVVSTRDGVLVARHENELSETTDVAAHPEFAGRRTTKTIDGRSVEGWFCEDFTLAEVRALRVLERLPFRSRDHDGRHQVPTLLEVLELARGAGAARGRPVGVYPETKHPTYFRSLGLALEEPLVDLLHRSGFQGPGAAAFVQSFEPGSLRRLQRLTDLPLVQLLDEREGRPHDLALSGDPRTFGDLAAPQGLAWLATFASAVGCHKRLLVPAGHDGRLLPPTSLVVDAHRAGLAVHAWTFRSEPRFLAPDYGGAPERELEQFLSLGVDGLFTDFPELAVAVRNRLHPEAGFEGLPPWEADRGP